VISHGVPTARGAAVSRGAAIVALAAAIVVAAVAVTSAVGLGAPAPRSIAIRAREFAFDPREVSVRAGEWTFEVKNEGSIEHNFVIEDSTRKTIVQIPVIDAGKTEDVKATLRAGAYNLVCSLPGHKDAGMLGVLRVQP
jgi:uncharacterized cupredoxin-like copper-binding protein